MTQCKVCTGSLDQIWHPQFTPNDRKEDRRLLNRSQAVANTMMFHFYCLAEMCNVVPDFLGNISVQSFDPLSAIPHSLAQDLNEAPKIFVGGLPTNLQEALLDRAAFAAKFDSHVEHTKELDDLFSIGSNEFFQCLYSFFFRRYQNATIRPLWTRIFQEVEAACPNAKWNDNTTDLKNVIILMTQKFAVSYRNIFASKGFYDVVEAAIHALTSVWGDEGDEGDDAHYIRKIDKEVTGLCQRLQDARTEAEIKRLRDQIKRVVERKRVAIKKDEEAAVENERKRSKKGTKEKNKTNAPKPGKHALWRQYESSLD
ncbi:hypothetical protein BG006_003199 [Podila minutissima]|uniref:Uncharacterized protein n=1 Tax=Podila minutissima TaxID=64525 RepID=A0A9P5SS12_9FUNG|nr:hypothetical protein BG006_003199 [Podila minutissima]